MAEKKKILIVDDEPELLSMIKMRIESVGHEVIMAANGQEGLEKVKAECPDLIITDVLMPVMDGFEFYKQLKKGKPFDEIPVLILTARGKMEDSFIAMGADEFVSKPFNSKELTEKIEKHLNRSRSGVAVQAAGKRVLVAGSDSETVENMVMQLKRAGCHHDLVSSGAQVISKAVMFLPDILLLEIQMDGMEPHQIIDVMRKMPQFEKIPILVYSYYRLSDLGSEDVRQRALSVDASENACKEAGATEYIGRFNENTFMKTIEKYLQ